MELRRRTASVPLRTNLPVRRSASAPRVPEFEEFVSIEQAARELVRPKVQLLIRLWVICLRQTNAT